MFTVNGTADPEASPLHEVNVYPAFGVGVRTTFAPLTYVNWSGF